MQEDPRLNRNKVHFPRLNIYEKNPVLSATIHLDKNCVCWILFM